MALQTKDYSVSGKSSGGGITYTYILRVTENSTNIANNTSNLTVQAILKSSYSGLAFSSWGTGVSCTLNGTQIFSDYQKRRCSGTAEHVYYTWTGNVSHNADGTLALQVGGKLWQDGSADYTPPTLTITESTASAMALTDIARESTVTATSANIEETAMIAVAQQYSGFTHSIAYRFGNLSGYINASGDPVASEVKYSNTSIGFKAPASFYAQIPNDQSGTCTLTCKTYSGSTQIGEAKTCTFVATAAKSRCAPAVSGTVVDINSATTALTGNANNILVKYYSTARCTLTATARNSASIKERKIAGSSVSGNTLDIVGVETGTFSFWAKDSRDYETTGEPVIKTLIPYVKLTNNAVGVRTDPTSGNAQIQFRGNYFAGSFGAVSNTLTVKYRQGSGDYITVTPTIDKDNNKYSAVVSLTGLDYTQSHSYEVVVKDELAEVTKTVTVGKGVPVFDWGENHFNVNVLFNDLTVKAKWISGSYTFRLQTKFTQWGAASSRQSMFLFGSDNWTPIYGLLTVRSDGAAQWSGQGALTMKTSVDDDSLAPGVVEVTLPAIMYDQLTLLSYGAVSFV